MPGQSDTIVPDVVCVLGMHRCGTSLSTKILSLAGLYLGSRRIATESGEDNRKGHWEHRDFVSLNDEILERHQGSWDHPPQFPPGWETSSAMDDLKQSARLLIDDHFAGVPLWGWKDPRTCLTLPFWQQLLPRMRYVICLRSPVDVAHSLSYRNGVTAEQSSRLWLRYITSAFQQTEGQRRVVVFYEDLMEDWLRELRRMSEFLGTPERADQADVQAAVQEFIEKELQHHQTSLVQSAATGTASLGARAIFFAKRISVNIGRKEAQAQEGLDHEIEGALDVLRQYSLHASGEPNPLIDRVAELEGQLAEGSQTTRGLEARLLEGTREKAGEVEALSARVAGMEETLKLVSKDLEEMDRVKEQAVQALSAQIAERDASLQVLSTQLTERDGAVYALSSQLAERDQAIQQHAEATAEHERVLQAQAAQLLDVQTQLNTVKGSLGWRVLNFFRSGGTP